MRRISATAVLLIAAVLAACGGPSGPSTPQANSVSPTVAERGDTITVSGARFGQNGTVSVGGVEATPTSWTDTAIELIVPATAPNGWQDVTVTTAGGSSAVEDMFVGVEFSGTGGELQAYLDGLELGTAVLLQAETYDLSANTSEFVIDNKDLYGRGEGQTTIVEPTAEATIVLADFGSRLTIADLTMHGDDLSYYHGTVTDTELPALTAATLADRHGLTGLQSAIAAAREIDPQAATGEVPHLVFERFTYQFDSAGAFGAPGIVLPRVDLTLEDTTITAPDGFLFLITGGNIVLDRFTGTAVDAQVLAPTGSITITDSAITIEDGLFAAETGMNVNGSEVRATNGLLQFTGAANALVGGSTLPAGGHVRIIGSTIESTDADLADASATGTIRIDTQFAPIELRDNTLIRAHNSISVATIESRIGEGDVDIVGNADVRVGVFKSEDDVNFRSGSMLVETTAANLRDAMTIADNVISTTGDFIATNSGAPGDIFVSGNTVTTGDDSPGQFLVIASGEGSVELTDNEVGFTGFAQAIATDLADGHFVMTGNGFTDTSPLAATMLVQAMGGSCVIDDNDVLLEDPGGATAQQIVTICLMDDPADETFSMEANEIIANGSVGSLVLVNAGGGGSLGMTDNQLTSSGVLVLEMYNAELTAGGNSFDVGEYLVITGNTVTDVDFEGNEVQVSDPQNYGMVLANLGSATLSGNTVTGTGTPSATAVALVVDAGSNATNVVATGNTFTGFSRSLLFEDVLDGQNGITAAINDNVFDFTIDAAPEVAELVNVADVIDATDNQWGANTDLATVEGYVTRDAETVTEGGDVLLDPIKLP